MTDRDVRERCAEIAQESLDELIDTTGNLPSTSIACVLVRDIQKHIRALDLPLTSAREVTELSHEDACALIDSLPKAASPFDYVRAGFKAAITSAPQLGAIRGEDGDIYTAAKLKELLDDRDRFIASKDLWVEYAKGAESFRSSPQPACVGVGDQGACKDSLLGPALQPTCMAADEEWCLRLVDRVTKAHHAVLDGRKNAAEDYLMDAIQALASPPSLSPAPSPQACGEIAAITESIRAFDDFINEPSQYENMRMVRDYRHEAARKWVPFRDAVMKLLATPAQQEAPTKARSSTAEPAAHNGLVAGSTPAAPTTIHKGLS